MKKLLLVLALVAVMAAGYVSVNRSEAKPTNEIAYSKVTYTTHWYCKNDTYTEITVCEGFQLYRFCPACAARLWVSSTEICGL